MCFLRCKNIYYTYNRLTKKSESTCCNISKVQCTGDRQTFISPRLCWTWCIIHMHRPNYSPIFNSIRNLISIWLSEIGLVSISISILSILGANFRILVCRLPCFAGYFWFLSDVHWLMRKRNILNGSKFAKALSWFHWICYYLLQFAAVSQSMFDNCISQDPHSFLLYSWHPCH